MLTTKKKKFAEAIYAGKNQQEAAISAGYSEKAAKTRGSLLASDPCVLKYLKMLEDDAINPTDTTSIDENIEDPICVMKTIMKKNIHSDPKLALDAASKLAPYLYKKLGESGKKQEKSEKAKNTNRFSPLPTPKLVVNNRK
ncbi:terminase small subunit [Arsenophonus nasoniae]|uniref:Terminase small subunit n=1 Tax=Arsenophonus nasoniae TaxID=638 RepID=A0AA95GFI3_9GAMM|nr:terminase small subunit [Arsenophonus nasoniae]WGL93776.1 terminase small subunit [Arsenophonus nasoniae]WGL96012.1 terminase small subunit [Arsenophonus nasoniae]